MFYPLGLSAHLVLPFRQKRDCYKIYGSIELDFLQGTRSHVADNIRSSWQTPFPSIDREIIHWPRWEVENVSPSFRANPIGTYQAEVPFHVE